MELVNLKRCLHTADTAAIRIVLTPGILKATVKNCFLVFLKLNVLSMNRKHLLPQYFSAGTTSETSDAEYDDKAVKKIYVILSGIYIHIMIVFINMGRYSYMDVF